MQRSKVKGAIGAVSVAGLAGMSLVGLGASPASADEQACGEVQIENSIDGGTNWTTNGRFSGEAPTAISVRLVGEVAEGCEYPVSLASYSAEGPSWETSGTQAFLGWDTVTLSSESLEATLDVSEFAPSCFGQIDLYGNGIAYDGTNGNELPHYPDVMTPENLIAAWNGEAPCEEEPPPVDEPEPPTEEPTEPAPEPEPTEPPVDEPSEEPSEPAPAPEGEEPAGDVEEPVGEPIALPEAESVDVDLAETGGDGSQLTLFAAVGGGLLVLGAAAFVIRRRLGGTTAS